MRCTWAAIFSWCSISICRPFNRHAADLPDHVRLQDHRVCRQDRPIKVGHVVGYDETACGRPTRCRRKVGIEMVVVAVGDENRQIGVGNMRRSDPGRR